MSRPTPSAVVSPRREDDPVPDPLPLRIAHRMIRGDLARLTGLAEDVVGGTTTLSRTRAKALSEYVTLFCESIHHHHTLEDELLWPVLAASAGAALDLHELEDDHSALDGELDGVRGSARALADDPGVIAVAAQFLQSMTALQTLLENHMADEDATVLPAIARYMSVADWKSVEKQAARSGARMSFDLPRVIDHSTLEEFATMTEATNATMIRVARLLVEPRFRRRERLLFGAAAA